MDVRFKPTTISSIKSFRRRHILVHASVRLLTDLLQQYITIAYISIQASVTTIGQYNAMPSYWIGHAQHTHATNPDVLQGRKR